MLLSFHYHSHLFLVFVQSQGHYDTVLSSLEVSPGLSFSQHWLLCALLCSLVLLAVLVLRACACVLVLVFVCSVLVLVGGEVGRGRVLVG